jgi:SapC
MTRHVLLNNVDHHDLCVITQPAAAYGDNINTALTFPTEYNDVQAEYPILFHKHAETGEFQSYALLGLARDENLFLGDDGWLGRYVPGIIARGPFLIGFQEQEVDGTMRKEPVIHVDLDDPRIGRDQGEPLFLEHGGNTPYLQNIASILRGIQDGIAVSKAMFAAFTDCELIEPVDIKIDVHDDVQFVLNGYYTISQDRLAALDGATLKRLQQHGFLHAAYMVLSSLNNIKRLIELKRERVSPA